MHAALDRLFCWLGLHAFEIEYRSAPGLFVIGGEEHDIEGTVERCQRPGCNRLFFSYKDWPRFECSEESRRRRHSAAQREGRVLVLA